MFKVMTIFGTRPEAIKMAPVVLELKKYPDEIQTLVTVTAQHREMLDQVLNLFEIKPDFDLNIMSQRQTLFDITTRAMNGLDEIFSKTKPDLVLVHGDTTTTLAGSLAAYYHQIPVGHVEAGLRTFNKYSPFPEEMNRRLTDAITDLNFAPTETSKQNLLREGTPSEKIFVTGNTVIDALHMVVQKKFSFDEKFESLFENSRVILVTTHRRENWGEPLRHVYQALKDVLAKFADVQIIFPVHRNPTVRKVVDEELGSIDRVTLIEPLEYQPFSNLMNRATLILTDSGGIQEEAPALGKPVLVLRDTTERPEAVEFGTVKLVGTDREKIFQTVSELLSDEAAYKKMSEATNPYGDGLASKRIVDAVKKFSKGLKHE